MLNPRDESRQDSTLREKSSDSGPVPTLSLTSSGAGTTFPNGPTSSAGGDLVVIANCPGCGTHYKHEPPKVRVRARCGRCDAPLDLARLSPYRIVSATAARSEDVESAARHLPIGLDHPALATEIARNVSRAAPATPSVAPPDAWEYDDPLPQIPEMTLRGAFESSVLPASGGDILPAASVGSSGRKSHGDEAPRSVPAGEGAATFALWLATGAIAGTGASWTMGGTTTAGMAAGAVLGAAVGWGWLRWTSPN
jgi:hypothetical protein